MTPIEMNEDDWAEKYKPLAAPIQGSGFSFGDDDTLIDGHRPEEVAALIAAGDDRIWTVIDGDEGDTVIVSGRHFVNRVGHIITEEPWGPEDVEVKLDD